jgi:lipoyl-dependent peroxiredoxin
MERRGNAEWNGGLKGGKGKLSSGSEVLTDIPYSFTTRFEEEPGTNPEELVAAAHAACFSMALSAQLEAGGHVPDSVRTVARVTLGKTDAGPTVTNVHLDVEASVPGIDEDTFLSTADSAKKGCPISRLLNAEITMTAKLV